MKLERRYIVFKISDTDSLTALDRDRINYLEREVERRRYISGKKPLECLCIEKDWPEYPVVLDLLSRRVDGKLDHFLPEQQTVTFRDYERLYKEYLELRWRMDQLEK